MYEQDTYIFQWILTMHKNERDRKWKNGIKVASNSWIHDHKMQSELVVKSKLRMYHGDRNLSKNNTQSHQIGSMLASKKKGKK